MKPKMTRDLAWAASQDAANWAMRRGGRTAWSEDDNNVMVEEFNRLWPVHLDIAISRQRASSTGTPESIHGKVDLK